jgi:hypothetical protein
MALFVHCKDIIPAVVALGRAAREKPKGKPKAKNQRKAKGKRKAPCRNKIAPDQLPALE